MRRSAALVIALTAAVVGASATPASAAAPVPKFEVLNPGQPPVLTEKVPVNVVFLGYEPAQVGKSAFLSGLPRTYEPVDRYPEFYGRDAKLGIKYTYDYKITYGGSAYENRFFRRLGALAKPAPLTTFQQQYNDQQKNVLDVTSNHEIDGPSVEKWLALNPPAGVDTRRNTVYFINWYGRSDFKFHVYTKKGEADPDTGYDFGSERQSRRMMAWGGTTADDEETGLGSTRRVWFHDLSAGPEVWTENWNVDEPDLDGNGVEDYRMPSIWEYAANGYRAPSALTGDLSKITRYVALNLLMTTSPLYPVELPADLPKTINIDSNTYEGWATVDASKEFITPKLLTAELAELRWRNRLDYDNQDLPFTGKALECFHGQYVTATSCYPDQDLPSDANLYLYNDENLARTKDDGDRVDYELPVFSYATGADFDTPLGYADDNWVDGTQSYVFAFVSPQIVESGYGLTTTLIHEVGHHLGMSHPHDGYDSETGVDYGPADEFLFANAGDQSNSMMSYIDVNWDFSQFDRDNSDRFLTAAYHEASNALAADILADPDGRKVYGALRAADGLLALSKAAFAAHEYRTAYRLAELAYDRLTGAADLIGVDSGAPARAMKAAADTARTNHQDDEPHEFIDTLAPDSPRAQP
ncbi:hypothetical protein [Jidongwangia harbinensis]|uniref:hypothetical protein n=1 Tax=Jidongwangia harbinensis TaxID=2878561 RepID=UPI001CD9F574|nr:hypothetical protein [Jidongwangia harbinensis]MCA2213210.1 hypothetical protein [Jidongwangia harbinensis]